MCLPYYFWLKLALFRNYTFPGRLLSAYFLHPFTLFWSHYSSCVCVTNWLYVVSVVVVFCYLLTTNLRLTTNWITQQFTSCVMWTTNCSLCFPFILPHLFPQHIIINCCGTRYRVCSIQIYKCTASQGYVMQFSGLSLLANFLLLDLLPLLCVQL